MPPITAAVLGAGMRGQAYGGYALTYPAELKITAVAEPDPVRRDRFARAHNLSAKRCFAHWEDLLHAGKIADAVFNCTMDPLHFESTSAALEAGYEVLLEKPMAPRLNENIRLVQLAEDQGRLLQICHVLRYTPFFQTLRSLIRSGRLGQVVNVDHRENVIFWHMAHSFVRGNWRNTAASAPMILTKCCHDLDILGWLLGQSVRRLSSFGSLAHFRPENAPHPDVPLRCTDGCPVADGCKYDAVRIYAKDGSGWPLDVVSYEPTASARLEALKTGPYGRCVYHSDNDVVDHQTVNMELEDGATVSLIMHGHSHKEGRSMRFDGTQGTLSGAFTVPMGLMLHDHLRGTAEHVPIPASGESGHGGGDFGLVRSFVNAMRGTPDDSLTTARESLESHLLAFAAEEARLTHRVIEMDEFRMDAEAAARQAYANGI